MCHVSNQISTRCNEEEVYYSCGSTMTFGDTAKTESILFCGSNTCDNEINTEEVL